MKKILRSIILPTAFFALLNTDLRAQNADTSRHVFQLGQVNIIGTRDSLRSDKLGAGTINRYNRLTVSNALNLLPGITLTAVGPRNESAVSVRGFDVRSVPIYLDGIPLYVPYDGYVDLARFNTFNLSEIQVAKGYSSVLYGPNAEGGAINLISRKPVKPFEFNAVAGWLSGGYRLNTNIGSNLGKFYYEVSASQLKRNWYPLSHDFKPVKNEDGGHRDNSYNNDVAVSGKVGFTPTANQEYAIGYSYQHGTKGTPVYAGDDASNSLFKSPRYWKWPNWDTQSLYLLSNNRINSTNVIKTRWYYDQFKNNLQSFDDASYSTMTKPYAFTSIYNDYTLGSSIMFENTSFKNNSFSLAGHFKQDVHREHNVGEPTRRDADNNFTVGAEDTYHITSAFKANAGVSYMNRHSTDAQQYTNGVISDLPANSNSAWNLQGLLQYDIDTTNTLSLSVARKTRFATIKDRYSYRFGTAIPNPDLKAENAVNYDLSYRTLLVGKLNIQASLFYSKINNLIQTVNNVQVDPKTGTQQSQVQNVGRAEYYGAEFAIGYPIANQLRIDANYTYLKRKNLSSPNIFLTDVPQNKVFGSIQYTPISKLYVMASEEYNSKRYSTSYGTVSGAFYLTNVKAHLTLIKGFSIEGGVNNLFDRNYTLVEGFPEAGRNYFANVIFNY
ncbi:TonB-dependent receptor plug domain-containing protein [Mucilaginibacter aquaedulcis]|uniref:TonB-dependent receptor plug domain-containing protein n=1 Tax=Mucilaginibacter aquaedulcis TaxID=1187081 RepID=UPI0025B3D56F|nr:TonB-dependent receptor [Mucilaginibacter aquaedulcis]MDN3549387.1 TonB-dependent receptor [Mucilaginibacter aquaedulcis]